MMRKHERHPLNPYLTLIQRVILILAFLLLSGCREGQIETEMSCKEVEATIRQYYANKYPAYAKFVAERQKPFESQDSTLRAPVREIMHSFPGRYMSFVETVALSGDRVLCLILDLDPNKDGGCRLGIKAIEQPGEVHADFLVAEGEPMTEQELREILQLK